MADDISGVVAMSGMQRVGIVCRHYAEQQRYTLDPPKVAATNMQSLQSCPI